MAFIAVFYSVSIVKTSFTVVKLDMPGAQFIDQTNVMFTSSDAIETFFKN